mmetsp:Transcript_60831/g.154114  ORF Transcript_60831/g.154114 Transcript_60831/m.154114 type:complete len:268 (-) Transcript_60831:198-1001(-)
MIGGQVGGPDLLHFYTNARGRRRTCCSNSTLIKCLRTNLYIWVHRLLQRQPFNLKHCSSEWAGAAPSCATLSGTLAKLPINRSAAGANLHLDKEALIHARRMMNADCGDLVAGASFLGIPSLPQQHRSVTKSAAQDAETLPLRLCAAPHLRPRCPEPRASRAEAPPRACGHALRPRRLLLREGVRRCQGQPAVDVDESRLVRRRWEQCAQEALLREATPRVNAQTHIFQRNPIMQVHLADFVQQVVDGSHQTSVHAEDSRCGHQEQR